MIAVFNSCDAGNYEKECNSTLPENTTTNSRAHPSSVGMKHNARPSKLDLEIGTRIDRFGASLVASRRKWKEEKKNEEPLLNISFIDHPILLHGM